MFFPRSGFFKHPFRWFGLPRSGVLSFPRFGGSGFPLVVQVSVVLFGFVWFRETFVSILFIGFLQNLSEEMMRLGRETRTIPPRATSQAAELMATGSSRQRMATFTKEIGTRCGLHTPSPSAVPEWRRRGASARRRAACRRRARVGGWSSTESTVWSLGRVRRAWASLGEPGKWSLADWTWGKSWEKRPVHQGRCIRYRGDRSRTGQFEGMFSKSCSLERVKQALDWLVHKAQTKQADTWILCTLDLEFLDRTFGLCSGCFDRGDLLNLVAQATQHGKNGSPPSR